jgi:hypothetical protein
MTKMSIIVLTLLFIAPAYAGRNCTRMKASDTLILHGHRQHAERFVECIVGHWPNVDSVFRETVPGSKR